MRQDSFFCEQDLNSKEIICKNLSNIAYTVKYQVNEEEEIIEATGFKGKNKECFNVSEDKELFYVDGTLIYRKFRNQEKYFLKPNLKLAKLKVKKQESIVGEIYLLKKKEFKGFKSAITILDSDKFVVLTDTIPLLDTDRKPFKISGLNNIGHYIIVAELILNESLNPDKEFILSKDTIGFEVLSFYKL